MSKFKYVNVPDILIAMWQQSYELFWVADCAGCSESIYIINVKILLTIYYVPLSHSLLIVQFGAPWGGEQSNEVPKFLVLRSFIYLEHSCFFTFCPFV